MKRKRNDLKVVIGFRPAAVEKHVSAASEEIAKMVGLSLSRTRTMLRGMEEVKARRGARQKILCKRYSTKSRMALGKQGGIWLVSLTYRSPGSTGRHARFGVNAAQRSRESYRKGISQLLCPQT